MKASSKMIAIILVTFAVISCRPFSKESYLEKYEKFISEISEQSAEYTEKEWLKADEKYKKFNEDWYDRFKEDLTWQEKLTITKYTVKYEYNRNKTDAIDFYNNFLKGDLVKLKEKIMYYKENDMDDDIDSLIKQAKQLGDTSLIVVQDLIRDVEEEINKNKQN